MTADEHRPVGATEVASVTGSPPGRTTPRRAPASGRPDDPDDRGRSSARVPRAPRLRIVRREEWRAEPARDWPVEVADTRAVVIHHTGRDGIGDLERLLHVQRFHAVTRGWGDIGYSYLVLPDGRVAEGREGTIDAGPGRSAVGGHALGRNVGTVGVAVVGRYDDDRPTDAAWASLIDLVADVCEGAGLDPHGGEVTLADGRTVPAVISGHRDVRDTPCPGEALAAALPELRHRVTRLLALGVADGDGGAPTRHAADR